MAVAPKLGSGGRFRKLSATLAARGAKDPDALAAAIGRKKYGAAKFGAMSHANDTWGYLNFGMADDAADTRSDPDNDGDDDSGSGSTQRQCPNCGYRSDNADFKITGGTADTDDPAAPDALRTPAPSTGGVRSGAATTVRGGAGGAGLANGSYRGRAVDLARRIPVSQPGDVMVSRAADGSAVIRHRAGGATIAELRRDGAGWVARVGGRDMPARTHQRTALMDAVGLYNQGAATAFRPATAPLQPPPQQTELMAQYGIPAIRALAAEPDADDDGTDDNGLSAKGQAIYKKLISKGFTAQRALAFAKRSQSTKSGQFGQASS
jgi:hypothetical protein